MNARAASLSIALLVFAALSAVELAMFRGIADRDRLRSRNDGEQTMNALFASLRDHDDFGSAIESSPYLASKIVGIGIYGSGARLYSWGAVPATQAKLPAAAAGDESHVREYVENPEEDSLILLLGAPVPKPPRQEGEKEPMREPERPEGPADKGRSFLRDTMRGSDIVYLEIRQADYWRRRRLGSLLFPAAEIATAALVLFVRSLVLRNAAYRKLIEDQRNLVILGTAASTLAHEIKNPLLAIRLQTSILAKLCPDSVRREIGIIDEEVERLSSLSYRVNDYLRDPAGTLRDIDPREILREVGSRLCGRDIAAASPPASGPTRKVRIDPERLRSMLENLVRNALEAGGPAEAVEAEVSISDRELRIDILDRGEGMPPEDRARAFDPFFTTKSRGTGLGLAVCARFARAVGGSVSLADRQGGGTRARLALPLEPEAPDDGGAAA